MYKNKRCKTFCIVINNVLSIVINIQNTTIFEPVILRVFNTSTYNELPAAFYSFACMIIALDPLYI